MIDEAVVTLSDIRKMTGEKTHNINYAIDQFGPAPFGRIGTTRVWLRRDLPAIFESLERTARNSSKPERRELAITH